MYVFSVAAILIWKVLWGGWFLGSLNDPGCDIHDKTREHHACKNK